MSTNSSRVNTSGAKGAKSGKRSGKKKGICYSFQRDGTCTRGGECMFEHVSEGGASGTGGFSVTARRATSAPEPAATGAVEEELPVVPEVGVASLDKPDDAGVLRHKVLSTSLVLRSPGTDPDDSAWKAFSKWVTAINPLRSTEVCFAAELTANSHIHGHTVRRILERTFFVKVVQEKDKKVVVVDLFGSQRLADHGSAVGVDVLPVLLGGPRGKDDSRVNAHNFPDYTEVMDWGDVAMLEDVYHLSPKLLSTALERTARGQVWIITHRFEGDVGVCGSVGGMLWIRNEKGLIEAQPDELNYYGPHPDNEWLFQPSSEFTITVEVKVESMYLLKVVKNTTVDLSCGIPSTISIEYKLVTASPPRPLVQAVINWLPEVERLTVQRGQRERMLVASAVATEVLALHHNRTVNGSVYTDISIAVRDRMRRSAFGERCNDGVMGDRWVDVYERVVRGTVLYCVDNIPRHALQAAHIRLNNRDLEAYTRVGRAPAIPAANQITVTQAVVRTMRGPVAGASVVLSLLCGRKLYVGLRCMMAIVWRCLRALIKAYAKVLAKLPMDLIPSMVSMSVLKNHPYWSAFLESLLVNLFPASSLAICAYECWRDGFSLQRVIFHLSTGLISSMGIRGKLLIGLVHGVWNGIVANAGLRNGTLDPAAYEIPGVLDIPPHIHAAFQPPEVLHPDQEVGKIPKDADDRYEAAPTGPFVERLNVPARSVAPLAVLTGELVVKRKDTKQTHVLCSAPQVNRMLIEMERDVVDHPETYQLGGKYFGLLQSRASPYTVHATPSRMLSAIVHRLLIRPNVEKGEPMDFPLCIEVIDRFIDALGPCDAPDANFSFSSFCEGTNKVTLGRVLNGDELACEGWDPLKVARSPQRTNLKLDETRFNLKDRMTIAVDDVVQAALAPLAEQGKWSLKTWFPRTFVRKQDGITVAIWYAAGRTQEELSFMGQTVFETPHVTHWMVCGDDFLGSWSLETGKGVECVLISEDDFSQFDGSRSKSSVQANTNFMEYLGARRELCDVLQATTEALRFKGSCGQWGFEGKAKHFFPTGIVTTTICNTTDNMMFRYAQMEKMIAHFRTNNDAISITAAVCDEVGFRSKPKVHERLLGATFLKGWWIPDTSGSLQWVNLPSMVMKISKMLNDPVKVFRRIAKSDREAYLCFAKSLSDGWRHFPREYPVLGAFLDACDRIGSEAPSAEYGSYETAVDENFRNPNKPVWSSETRFQLDVDIAYNLISERYGGDPAEWQSLDKAIREIPSFPWRIDHRLLDALMEVDYA